MCSKAAPEAGTDARNCWATRESGSVHVVWHSDSRNSDMCVSCPTQAPWDEMVEVAADERESSGSTAGTRPRRPSSVEDLNDPVLLFIRQIGQLRCPLEG
jgi:hypothetical protein